MTPRYFAKLFGPLFFAILAGGTALAQCPSGSAPGVVTATASQTTYQATNCLQTAAGQSITINGAANITYESGSTIYLNPGFTANSAGGTGTTFTAKLGPMVTTTSLQSGTVGTSYQAQLAAQEGSSNGPFYWTANGLPSWLSLNPNSGLLSGTPAAAASISFSVIAQDGLGVASLPQPLSLGIAGGSSPLSITTASIPGGTAGSYYSQSFAASGGTPPYSWSLASGQLPVGVTLGTSGQLIGVPVVANSFPFSVQATDAAGNRASGSFTFSVAANSSTLSGNTPIHVNLSYLPFNIYDYAHPASSNFSLSCPLGATVRSCFQTVLVNMRAQGVSGVRIFVPICDAFPTCGLLSGQTWTNYSWNPGASPAQSTWITNVGSFFSDVHAAGINNVTITIVHGSTPVTDSLPSGATSQPAGHAQCANLPATVYFTPTQPFGLDSSTLYPIGVFQNNAYNCAPSNPYFIGWNNQFDAIGAILAAAKNKVNVFELEFEQELNLVASTAELRYIYDNAHQMSGGVTDPNGYVDILSRLRTLMTNNSFLPSRVTWSAETSETTDPSNNCPNIYGDFSRMFNLDEIQSAIAGWYVGLNGDATLSDGLWCGGVSYVNDMILSQATGDALPGIVDLHAYPQTVGGTLDTQIQQAANWDFFDLNHFQQLFGMQSALVMIGETHSPSQYPGYSGTLPCAIYPNSAASSTVAGFNANAALFSGTSVVFRPWMELEDPAGECFPYITYQNFNPNGSGPYTPTVQ
jgi:hypothetical protein